MHGFILTFNMAMIIVALAMDTIHTTVPGTFCHFAAVPTGCRQSPEKYGECDKDLAAHVMNLLLLNSVIIPFFCLVGIVTTMVMLLRNVLMRERIFQASYGKQDVSKTKKSSLRNVGVVSDTAMSEPTGTDSSTRRALTTDSDSRPHLGARATNSPKELQLQSVRNSTTKAVSESELFVDDDESSVSTIEPVARVLSASSEVREGANSKEIEAARLARLYRKETMLQAFLYVGAFIFSFFPTWMFIVCLLSGFSYESMLLSVLEIYVGICYPIQGLLNIYVYTRPFVNSLRRRHPQCSWLHAFFLVFSAGGEVPDDIDPKKLKRFHCCSRKLDEQENDAEAEDEAGDNISGRRSRPVISSQAFGVSARMKTSIQIQSVQAVDCNSQSIEEDNVAHRPREQWDFQPNRNQSSQDISLGDFDLHTTGVSFGPSVEQKLESGISFARSTEHDQNFDIERDDRSSKSAGSNKSARSNRSARLRGRRSPKPQPKYDLSGKNEESQSRGSILSLSSFSIFKSRTSSTNIQEDKGDDDIWGQAFARVKKYNPPSPNDSLSDVSDFDLAKTNTNTNTGTGTGTKSSGKEDNFDEDDIWNHAFKRVKKYNPNNE